MSFPNRRSFSAFALAAAAGAALWSAPSLAQALEAPDAMIGRLSGEVLETIRSDRALQNGDIGRVVQVVDAKIMPNVNFTRMTASATGPAWRRATPEQRQRLQQEFKTLLVRTYAGALRQVNDQTVEMLPMRGSAADKEVVVRTLIRGRGEPVQVDYRMERAATGWKIYDLNVMGVWLVDNYRPQFAQQINTGGVDALIRSLAERNQANVAGR